MFALLKLYCKLTKFYILKSLNDFITIVNREKQLSPQELKQLELEKKLKEREELKAKKKLVADFKKLWYKPKEDLEVEDLKVFMRFDCTSF